MEGGASQESLSFFLSASILEDERQRVMQFGPLGSKLERDAIFVFGPRQISLRPGQFRQVRVDHRIRRVSGAKIGELRRTAGDVSLPPEIEGDQPPGFVPVLGKCHLSCGSPFLTRTRQIRGVASSRLAALAASHHERHGERGQQCQSGSTAHGWPALDAVRHANHFARIRD
jgi:hypothetical protein